MPARYLRAAAALCGAALGLAGLSASALGQANYTPLEEGDYTELEQRVVVLRGIEAGVDYALRVSADSNDDLPGEDRKTDIKQDLRLHLNTVMHQDVSVHLTLEPGAAGFIDDTDLRTEPRDDRGRLADAQPSGIQARQAYLKYRFNPRSALLTGKHELSLGDRRGKVFHALVPAATFDCEVGTWCMPFGMANLGSREGDALYHWALQYTAWETEPEGFRNALDVEIFRIIYQESNIPLGTNLGPTTRNPDDPSAPADSQITEPGTGNALFYDAKQQDYYGIRINWEWRSLFAYLDATSNQGQRGYHRYRDPDTGLEGDLADGDDITHEEIRGLALEAELGWRWAQGRVGLRWMRATGDEFEPTDDADAFRRSLTGYHEITPGTYRGSRLYFNGGDGDVDQGAGLGHSINNTEMTGLFLDYEDRGEASLGYSLGLFHLQYNHAIPNEKGDRHRYIGLEMNNRLTWFVHPALRLEMEANGILPGPAFRVDDFSTPLKNPDRHVQGIGRVVYTF